MFGIEVGVWDIIVLWTDIEATLKTHFKLMDEADSLCRRHQRYCTERCMLPRNITALQMSPLGPRLALFNAVTGNLKKGMEKLCNVRLVLCFLISKWFWNESKPLFIREEIRGN